MKSCLKCLFVDLIYRPYSNDVIGYADTGDDNLNNVSCGGREKVVDHMLAIYVRGNKTFSQILINPLIAVSDYSCFPIVYHWLP